jgi:hypothetical protein
VTGVGTSGIAIAAIAPPYSLLHQNDSEAAENEVLFVKDNR